MVTRYGTTAQNMNSIRDYWRCQLQNCGFQPKGTMYKYGYEWFLYEIDLFRIRFTVRTDCVSEMEFFISRPFSMRAPLEILEDGKWSWIAEALVLDLNDEGVHVFLDALADPKLFPTCVGIPWAASFLEKWFRDDKITT